MLVIMCDISQSQRIDRVNDGISFQVITLIVKKLSYQSQFDALHVTGKHDKTANELVSRRMVHTQQILLL